MASGLLARNKKRIRQTTWRIKDLHSLKGGNREVGLVIGYPVHRILILKERIFFIFPVPTRVRRGSALLSIKKCPPTSPAGQDLHSLKGGNREVGLVIGYPFNRKSNRLIILFGQVYGQQTERNGRRAQSKGKPQAGSDPARSPPSGHFQGSRAKV